MRRDRLRFVLEARRVHGDVVAFTLGWRSLYLVSHPDHFRHVLIDNPSNYRKGLGLVDAAPLLGEGLLTAEGERWAAHRRLLVEAFRGERLDAGYAPGMMAAAISLRDQWQAVADSGRTVDVARALVLVALEVLGSTLLGGELITAAESVAADLAEVSGWAVRRMTSVIKLPLRVPTPRNLRMRRALARLDRCARRLAQAPGEPPIVMSLLRSLCGHAGTCPPDREMRDEVLTLLLAGHETTAATLAWTFYLLARNPRVEAELHRELDVVLGGRAPLPADLPRLCYTRMVVQETLRLYPAVWMIPRRALASDRIGPYRIPAGSDVLLCVYSLHRHPELWPTPEAFWPERFSSESRDALNAYLPFGAGPRACIGSRFGLLEAVAVLATLAQAYRLRLTTDDEVEGEAGLTLKPAGGLPMRVYRRANADQRRA